MIKKGILTAITLIACTLTGVAKQNSDPPVIALLERYSPEASKRFVFEITDPQGEKDFFTVSSTKNKIYISGNNDLSLASGLNFYLKNILGVSITSSNTSFDLPKQLPEVTTPIRRETEVATRLYLNNESYKGERTYWGYEEWQREIDRMALAGVNMVYLPVGVGTVWHNTLVSMGIEEDEAAAFLPMPSYYAWWTEGQCKGGSQDLPLSWYEGERKLQNKLLAELKKWHIEPVAQGYNGAELPASLSKEEFANHYYTEMNKLYGAFRYFNVPTIEAATLLQKNNPDAVWLYDIDHGKASATEIASLPRGSVLLVGTYDNLTDWDKTGASGHHNFVLRPTLAEPQENLYNRPYRNRLLFCGIELSDDDTYRINSNFISAYLWNSNLAYQDYIKMYVRQVYGSPNPTVEKAIAAMYDQSTSTARPFLYSEPALPKSAPDLLKTDAYITALKAFAGEAAKYANNPNYQHDLILFTQIALYNRCQELAVKMAHSVDSRSSEFFKKESEKFLALLLMLDKLYYTRPEFRFDNYVEMGRAKGITHVEQGVYEGDIRHYSTIWGDRYTANMLHKNDICHAPQSGILGDYYYNRWYLYIKSLNGILSNKIEGDIDYYNIGKAWSEQRNTFPEQPKSSTILRAVEIINYLNAPI